MSKVLLDTAYYFVFFKDDFLRSWMNFKNLKISMHLYPNKQEIKSRSFVAIKEVNILTKNLYNF